MSSTDNDETESFARLLQRTARALPLNSRAQVQAMKDTLAKVTTNICENPTEPKFRSLRLTHKVLRSKIFDRSGGAEVMHVLNFRRGTTPDTLDTMTLALEAEAAAAEA